MPRRHTTRSTAAVAAVALTVLGSALGRAQTRPETVVEIRVQGNFTLPDEEVIALAGVVPGDEVGPDLLDAIARALEGSGRFESVDVRKRYRSLTATDRVSLVLVVRERAAARSANPVARSFGEIGRHTMLLPILSYDEGYGLSYGVRTSFVDMLGRGGRLSVPAAWGGRKRIALEAETPLSGRVVDRVLGGVSRGRRRHPHFDLDEDRTRLWVEAERGLPLGFRVTGAFGWEDVELGVLGDRLTRSALALEHGTAVDTSFPRDDVIWSAGLEWIAISGEATTIVRPRVDARAFKGVGGQTVLAARVVFEGASTSLPAYEQSLLGGGGSLCGWRVGEQVGDRLAAASLEIRMPMSSPLSVGKMGVKVFYDTAAVYDVGQSIRKTRFLKGAGAGVFLSLPVVQLQLDVAHDLIDSIRLHFGAGVTF